MNEATTKGESFADTLTLTLREPIQVGGVEHAVLELSEPSMKQLREAEKAGTSLDQLAKLISLNARVPMAVVDAMKQRDLSRAGDFFAHFGDPSTSSTS